MGALWVWTGQWDKMQSEKKSAQNNSDKSEKHLFSVYIVGGTDKPYLLCFFHNYTINQVSGSKKNSWSSIWSSTLRFEIIFNDKMQVWVLSLAHIMSETLASRDAVNVSRSFIALRIAYDLC